MNNKTIRTLDVLLQKKLISKNDLPDLQEVVETFSLAISEQMHQLIDKSDPNDPIAKQFVPSRKELTISSIEQIDPIGDEVHTTVKGIIHRYPDRCLFTPVHVCPVYCRFCFRREKIGTAAETLSPDELEAAYDYISHHQEIWEVIITGGDPFILKPEMLKRMLDRLAQVNHVEVIRIHTRIPVVESHRVNAEMLIALKLNKPVYVVLHANHPNEFTPEAVKACAVLVDAGIPLLSQTTLLKDINDNIDVLSTLMRCFIRNRIKPYYLHQGDLVRGTQHFRTTVAEGQHLMQQLRGRFSGICQPTYVLDIPGGYGKIPIGPSYISTEKYTESNETYYNVKDYCGNNHQYPPVFSNVDYSNNGQ
ncbi:MAG: lysine 2,3-aminomutase [Gammaproteobacteria bacterium RIFCSPHIGHO2_12_FULL_42_13]|nr:MAG: lysine 2,3-aminomutase [Gammaproteobacteria bacterium RIFCSPHIGHO2_12_FULL_42_13]